MTTLYCKDNVSDKVYQVSVDICDGGYDVNFAYGRRGSTMNTGKKNGAPLRHDAAQNMADKLVREKMAKGYTPGETGAVYTNTDKADRFTGILPMLLNPISEGEIERYIQDPNWVLQEKFDGKRIMVRKTGNVVKAINRKGLLVDIPKKVADEIAKIPGDFLLDGEMIGEKYYVFDRISDDPLRTRLMNLPVLGGSECVIAACSYFGADVKRHQALVIKSEGREGLVFKLLSAYYSAGRPNSGGPALKCKFTATVNVRVKGVNVQRSIEIALEDGTPCGNVAIPVNKAIPQVGDLVEVRYLYAMPNTNALYQPIYSRERDDIDFADGISVLKYKKAEEE